MLLDAALKVVHSYIEVRRLATNPFVFAANKVTFDHKQYRLFSHVVGESYSW